MEVNTVDKATDTNDDPSKDSDDIIDAENMNGNEPNCFLDNVEVNTVDKANDTNGHPSKDSDDRINAENMNVEEPDIIYNSSKINDANAEQTELMVDDNVEQNDVSTNINQSLQKETVSDDVEIEKVDKTTDTFGHASTYCDDRKGLQKETVSDDVEMENADKTTDDFGRAGTDCDHRIDVGNTIIDQGRDLFIQDGVKMNDASAIIQQKKTRRQYSSHSNEYSNWRIEYCTKWVGRSARTVDNGFKL